MNNNAKKKKKNITILSIIIFISIIILIFIFIYGNDSLKNKPEIVICNYATKRVSVTQRVEYIDDVFSYLELEQKMDFSGLELKISLDELQKTLEDKFEEQFKTLSNKSKYFVEINNETLVWSLNLSAEDYKKIENYLNELDETATSIDNFYDDQNRFINQIISQGGDCTYED